jgi:hypothetical protein
MLADDRNRRVTSGETIVAKKGFALRGLRCRIPSGEPRTRTENCTLPRQAYGGYPDREVPPNFENVRGVASIIPAGLRNA